MKGKRSGSGRTLKRKSDEAPELTAKWAAGADLYREMLNASYKSIKSVNPNIHVAVNFRSIRLGDHTQWVDPILGLRFGVDLSKTVVLGVAGDVGGFNIGNYCSDFTWSQTTMLSWAFADSWSAHFGYRLLDFHRDAGSANVRMQMRGPFLATSYRF